jgi:hypothetical protein
MTQATAWSVMKLSARNVMLTLVTFSPMAQSQPDYDTALTAYRLILKMINVQKQQQKVLCPKHQ